MKVNVEFQEPDRKKKIKRIIAREGLIIIGTVVLIVLFNTLLPKLLQYKGDIFDEAAGTNRILFLCQGLIYALYPLYLTIRFIIWAIRIVKEK